MGTGLQPATGRTTVTGPAIGVGLYAEQAVCELLGQFPLTDAVLPADQQGVWQAPLRTRTVQAIKVLLQPFQFYDYSLIDWVIQVFEKANRQGREGNR